jgi:hypothetical protein
MSSLPPHAHIFPGFPDIEPSDFTLPDDVLSESSQSAASTHDGWSPDPVPAEIADPPDSFERLEMILADRPEPVNLSFYQGARPSRPNRHL